MNRKPEHSDMILKVARYEIRPALPSDIQEIHSLEVQAFKKEAYPISFLRQALELYPNTFLVVVQDERYLGHLLAVPNSPETPQGWILSIAVIPKARRFGIGRALLTQIVSILSDCSVRKIWLSVRPDNTSAKILFQRAGFVHNRTEMDYFGSGETREIMVLEKKD